MTQPRCPATLALTALVSIGFATWVAGSAQSDKPSSRANAITVTGCLRSADQMAVGTSGSSVGTASGGRSANDSSTKFVLTNAASSGSPAETSGTSGAKGASPATGYRLDADESKLTSHVGHKVEISGTIENPGSTSAAADDAFSGAPRLKVVSIRTLASNCGQ
jgi:hypothetical protein